MIFVLVEVRRNIRNVVEDNATTILSHSNKTESKKIL
jgi:hypothetical protein